MPSPGPSHDTPDDQLMARLAAGRAEALDALVARHEPRLRRWLGARGLQEHDARDCLQDTWLRLVRSAPRYTGQGRFQGFLSTLARASYGDWCRRLRPVRDLPPDLDQAASPGLEAGLALDLSAALARLPAHQAAVLELTVQRGLGYAEAAERLGIPVGTVKSRVHHAVRRLRRELCDDR